MVRGGYRCCAHLGCPRYRCRPAVSSVPRRRMTRIGRTRASARSDGGQGEGEGELSIKEHQATLPEFFKYLPNGPC